MKKTFVKLLFVICAVAPSFIQSLPLHLFLVGTGGVGRELLQQIEKNHSYFQDIYGIDIRVVAVANTKMMAFNAEGFALNHLEASLMQAEPMTWDNFYQKMIAMDLPHKVFVDCTSNQTIADTYATILAAGISISTPNKKANSSHLEYYKKLQPFNQSSQFFYDANVGAALPILSSMKSLQRSGDEVLKIEGIFSGTLSYLFNTFNEGTAFSALVKDAQDKGYTEPDPRDDLNGMDAARKLLILCREAGFDLEMKDITIQRFLPDECFEAPTVGDFYVALAQQDSYFSDLIKTAHSDGKRLRFIASFENGKARLSLQAIGPEHPFYHLSGTDNIISITSGYYLKNPLVIKGPGAGTKLTAAKVLEGIVKIGLNQQ